RRGGDGRQERLGTQRCRGVGTGSPSGSGGTHGANHDGPGAACDAGRVNRPREHPTIATILEPARTSAASFSLRGRPGPFVGRNVFRSELTLTYSGVATSSTQVGHLSMLADSQS